MHHYAWMPNLYSARDQIRGFVHAKQALYQFCHMYNTPCCSYLNLKLIFSLGTSALQVSPHKAGGSPPREHSQKAEHRHRLFCWTAPVEKPCLSQGRTVLQTLCPI